MWGCLDRRGMKKEMKAAAGRRERGEKRRLRVQLRDGGDKSLETETERKEEGWKR